ncbi:hypothetical protein ACE2AJ_20685 [Aquihabitans daechungensis]|uniref:hypothetical protein n=1 Tax=Aquihabitans daechungensis TaxID=1052257 RepID=UPI003B9FDA88
MKVRSQTLGDPVAAYASLEGAERAVSHLVSHGYDEEEVGIAPRAFEEVDRHPFRELLDTWLLRWGLIGGASIAALLAVVSEVGVDALVESVLPTMAWGAAAGVAIGLVIAVVAYRIEKARTFFTAEVELEPTRFEVVADQHPDRARNDLARWWDPAAPSAGWEPPA